MNIVRSISAILLAALVLLSSTTVLVGMHFCMGEVQNVALFAKAEGCEKEKSLPPCHRHEKAPCCDDETLVHKGDDFNAAAPKFHIIAPVSSEIEQPSVFISEIIPATPSAHFQYYNYDPPLRSCDRTVELHVFLI